MSLSAMRKTLGKGLETFLFVSDGGEGGCCWHLGGRSQDALKFPTVNRISSLTTNSHLAQSVHTAEADKLLLPPQFSNTHDMFGEHPSLIRLKK